MPDQLIDRIAASAEYRDHLVNMLVDICEIDTTIRPDVKGMREAESKVFDILKHHINSYGLPGARLEQRPIDPAIAEHPFFSQLYYTRSPQRPEGLTVEQTYDGRGNLMLLIDGSDIDAAGVNQAMNVHVDVVQPYIPPRVEGGVVYGRGACDDKGNAVALMGALKLVAAYLKEQGQSLPHHLTCMFVLDEEMGGNGSLSAAIDDQLKARYDSLMVLEICENRLFPGNRGCVWFKIEATAPEVNMFELGAFIIEQLEKEGRSLRSESDHELFPHRPVQTCHGILGNCGQHPSRINGDIGFDIHLPGGEPANVESLIRDILDFALAEYIGVYGDKTKVNDPTTGKPKVDHHYDLSRGRDGLTVRVFGSTGHMGAILENDGAITKMATMVRALIRSRAMIENKAGGKMVMHQQGWDEPHHLVMEGGQGFLPTHEMPDVQRRVTESVKLGAKTYAMMHKLPLDLADAFEVTFEKLHNAAFAGDPDSKDMRNAIEAMKQVGLWKGEPIRGWDVSCDARIFAKQYPDLNVLTTGPGSLNYAHSDHEQINIDEMIQASRFLAYFILKQTGAMQ